MLIIFISHFISFIFFSCVYILDRNFVCCILIDVNENLSKGLWFYWLWWGLLDSSALSPLCILFLQYILSINLIQILKLAVDNDPHVRQPIQTNAHHRPMHYSAHSNIQQMATATAFEFPRIINANVQISMSHAKLFFKN